MEPMTMPAMAPPLRRSFESFEAAKPGTVDAVAPLLVGLIVLVPSEVSLLVLVVLRVPFLMLMVKIWVSEGAKEDIAISVATIGAASVDVGTAPSRSRLDWSKWSHLTESGIDMLRSRPDCEKSESGK